MLHLFHKIHLPTVDPLGGGLAEEIVAEQAEPDHMTLEESIDANELATEWNEIVSDVKKDPDWFDFSED